MRHEVQQRDKIRLLLEVVSAGSGITGLSPTAVLKRASDGQYWDGAAWAATSTALAMVEVDVVDQPGLYSYDLPTGGFDAVLGASGYEAVLVEATQTVRQNVRIDVYDEVTEATLSLLTLTATVFDAQQDVQVGSTSRVSFGFKSDLPAYGKALGVSLVEARLSVGAVVHDLLVDGVPFSEFVESARATGDTASVTASPTFGFSNPDLEEIVTLAVDDSSVFVVGEYIRLQDAQAGQGHVYEIRALPTGTSIVLNAPQDQTKFYIANGTIVEAVNPSGVYTGFLDLPVDTYFSTSDPIGTLLLVGLSSVEDKAPGFVSAEQVEWVRTLELDLVGRGFRAG